MYRSMFRRMTDSAVTMDESNFSLLKLERVIA